MSAYVYEFLFRGRPPGSAEAPAWHVVLAQEVAPPGAAPQTVLSDALTPERAAAAGFDLAALVEGVNGAALVRADRADAAAAAAVAATAEARDRLAVAMAELALLRAGGGAAANVISDRQFAQALAELGVITRDEALAFVRRGEVPAALKAVIDAIPDPDERFAVDMQVSGATTYQRSHPSTLALAAALGWSDAQMDELWARARLLV